uniref:Glycosyltransferase family 28 N-terminal domain-containing protein n=1 Tax=Paramoeba aestuarina TaxID=180227 RepID=A0A7S4NXG8_9EUKA
MSADDHIIKKLLVEAEINEDRAGQYLTALLENDIDIIEAVLELTDAELKEDIGIKMLGDRAKIRKLKENQALLDKYLDPNAYNDPDAGPDPYAGMTADERENEAARQISMLHGDDGRLNFSQMNLDDMPEDDDMEEVELLDVNDFSAANTDESRVPLMNVAILIVGSRGDVQPFVALGKELRKFGHRVRLASHTVFQQFIVENDIEFAPIAGDPKELMAHMVKHPGLMPGSMDEVKRKRVVMKEIIESCWTAVTDTKSVIHTKDGEPNNPNLPDQPWCTHAILSNPATFGHYHVAERLGCPLHIFFTMPWSPTAAFPHPLANLSYAKRTPSKNMMSYSLVDALTWSGLGDLCNSFRKNHLGLEQIMGTGGRSLLDDAKVPHAYTWSPNLIGKPKDWGDHIDITGFFFLDLATNYTPPDDLLEFLQAGPPPIYVGFGSIVVENPDAFNKAILDAFRSTNYRGIVSKGWSELGGSGDVPKDVYVIGNCPHDWLFLQCAAVCHHGGAGTTAAGLLAGKPSIVCPFFGDQPFWGQMIANKGVGPAPIFKKKFNAETLAEAFRFCMKPETQEKAKKLGEEMRKENGVRTGVQVFHAHLPILDMCCDVDPKLPATIFCSDCRMRLSDEAHAVIHDPNGNRKEHRWFRYGSCNWKPRPPRAAKGLETAYTGAWHIGLASVGGLVSKPKRGFKEGGAAGLAKGIGQGTAGLVAAPFKGTAYFFSTLSETGKKKGSSGNISQKSMQVGDSVVEIPCTYGGFFLGGAKGDWKGDWHSLNQMYEKLTKQASKEKGHAQAKVRHHKLNPPLPNIDHVPKQRRQELFKAYCLQLGARNAERDENDKKKKDKKKK